MNKEAAAFARERHWQTQALVDVFVGLKENDVTTYETLAQRSKMSVTDVHNRMSSARRIARDEHHVLLRTAVKIGVERIRQDQVAVPVDRHLKRIRSEGRQVIRTIKNGITDFDKLPSDVKTDVLTKRAIAGVVMLATTASSHRVLKEHVETSNGELKIGRTLELLK